MIARTINAVERRGGNDGRTGSSVTSARTRKPIVQAFISTSSTRPRAQLSLLSTSWAGDEPSYLAFHPNGRYLYAVSETGEVEGQPGPGKRAVHRPAERGADAAQPGTQRGRKPLLCERGRHGPIRVGRQLPRQQLCRVAHSARWASCSPRATMSHSRRQRSRRRGTRWAARALHHPGARQSLCSGLRRGPGPRHGLPARTEPREAGAPRSAVHPASRGSSAAPHHLPSQRAMGSTPSGNPAPRCSADVGWRRGAR